MEEITAYQTTDGKLFEEHREALDHQSGIVGELLDTLLPDDEYGHLTRVARHDLLMKMLKSPELKDTIEKLFNALDHPNWEECRKHVVRKYPR